MVIKIIIGTYNSRTLLFRQLSKYSLLNSKASLAFLIGGIENNSKFSRQMKFSETRCDKFLENIRYIHT